MSENKEKNTKNNDLQLIFKLIFHCKHTNTKMNEVKERTYEIFEGKCVRGTTKKLNR